VIRLSLLSKTITFFSEFPKFLGRFHTGTTPPQSSRFERKGTMRSGTEGAKQYLNVRTESYRKAFA